MSCSSSCYFPSTCRDVASHWWLPQGPVGRRCATELFSPCPMVRFICFLPTQSHHRCWRALLCLRVALGRTQSNFPVSLPLAKHHFPFKRRNYSFFGEKIANTLDGTKIKNLTTFFSEINVEINEEINAGYSSWFAK